MMLTLLFLLITVNLGLASYNPVPHDTFMHAVLYLQDTKVESKDKAIAFYQNEEIQLDFDDLRNFIMEIPKLSKNNKILRIVDSLEAYQAELGVNLFQQILIRRYTLPFILITNMKTEPKGYIIVIDEMDIIYLL